MKMSNQQRQCDASARRRRVRITLAACASGQSILQAGNDGTTTTKPPAPATTGRPRWRPPTTICLVQPCARADGERRWAADDDPAGRAGLGRRRADRVGMPRRASRRPLAGNPDFATCPVDALESVSEPVHITFWHAMQSAQGDALAALTDQYNASQDRVVVELQNQNGYEELIDKYFQSSMEDRPARHADARVHAPADGRRQLGDHARQRASRPTASTSPRSCRGRCSPTRPAGCSGRCRSTSPARCSTTTGRCSRRPASTPTPHRSRSTSCVTTRSRSSTRARRPTASPSTRASTPAAPGSSSSGSPAPGCPTPTTTTGARHGRRRCCSTRPRRWNMLTFAQDLVDDGLAVYVGEDPQGIDGLLRMADPQQPAAMTIASSGALGGVLSFVEGGRDRRDHVGRHRGRADARVRATRRARRSAGRRCTSCATRATPRRRPHGTTSSTSSAPRRSRTGRAPAATRRCATTPPRSSRWRRPTPTTHASASAYDQVNFTADDFTAVGPVLGPMRQVRQVTAADDGRHLRRRATSQDALTAAADQANLLIIDYNNRN